MTDRVLHVVMPHGPEIYLILPLAFGGILLGVGLLTMVWMRVWTAMISLLVSAALRLGVDRPTTQSRRRSSTLQDRNVLRFIASLETVSTHIPGDPLGKPRTVILPLLLVGGPIAIGMLIVAWVVPLLLFGYFIATVSGPWSTLVAILAVFLYMSLLLVAWRVAKVIGSTSVRWIASVTKG